MSSNANLPVRPTVSGVTIESTADALKIVQGCADGIFQCVPRRPLDNERLDLIRSGNVFVYEETVSRIKRWTDSIRWSPSRAMTNLLVYREVFDKFKPGGRRVIRSNARSSRVQPYPPGRPSPHEQDQNIEHLDCSSTSQDVCTEIPAIDPLLQALRPEERKAVVGSLHDSYLFKEDGLCKKTLAVNINHLRFHIVAYFKISDVLNKTLKRPEEVFPHLRNIEVFHLIPQNPRYKHNIEVSGRYDKDGQPLYDDDKGDGIQDLDVSGYDSGSSDMGGDIIHTLEPLPERQLPLPLPHSHGGGLRHPIPNHDLLDISFGQHYQLVQQHSMQFLQEQAFPSLQQQLPPPPHIPFSTIPFQQPSEPSAFQPLQEPNLPQDNNIFSLYPQADPLYNISTYPSSHQQSRPMLPANEPRSMPSESSSFVTEPSFQFRRPANMEPNIQHFSNTELKNYQFAKKRDDDGNVQGNSFRQPAAPLIAPEPRLPEHWSGAMMDNFPGDGFDWNG